MVFSLPLPFFLILFFFSLFFSIFFFCFDYKFFSFFFFLYFCFCFVFRFFGGTRFSIWPSSITSREHTEFAVLLLLFLFHFFFIFFFSFDFKQQNFFKNWSKAMHIQSEREREKKTKNTGKQVAGWRRTCNTNELFNTFRTNQKTQPKYAMHASKLCSRQAGRPDKHQL